MPTTNTTSNSYPFFSKEDRPGTLIVVEWSDWSGKSTQAVVMQKLLEANGFFVHFSEWNSSKKIKPLTKKLKQNDLRIPAATFDMLFAADFMERYVTEIQTKLEAGMIVICDRYTYTGMARWFARGLPLKNLEGFYNQFFEQPDISFYFKVTPEIAFERASKRKILKHYEAGMDVGYSDNIIESFHMFQEKVIEAYDTLAQTENMRVIDGSQPVYATTPSVVKILSQYFKKKYDVQLMWVH